MSLINQMLRDLEARQADTGQRSSAFQGLTGGTMPRRHSPVLMAALVIGVAAGAAAIAWFAADRTHRPVQHEMVATTGSRPAPVTQAGTVAPSHPMMQIAATATAPVNPTLNRNDTPVAPPQPQPKQQRPTIQPHAATTPPPRPAVRKSRRLRDETRTQDAPSGFEIHRRALTPQQHAASRYQEALALLRQRQIGEAETKLREALQMDQGYVQAAEALGALLINEGRMVEAAPIIDAARRRNPQRPTLELLAARVRLAQGDVAGATKLLEDGLSFSGGRADYVAFLAALYQKQQKFGASIQAYQRAVELNPDVPTWWVGLAISDEGAGHHHDAAQAYARALQGNLPTPLRNYAQQRLAALKAHSATDARGDTGLH